MLSARLPGDPIALPGFLAGLVRLPRPRAWLLTLLCVDLAALADIASGPTVWVGPVYLFVICLAAWSLGWRAGQAVGIGCMALTLAINGMSLYPHGSASLAANFAMRFAAVSIVVALIGAMRRAYLREWHLARTDALTGAFNRQAFFELGAELCARQGWKLMIYADLDGLKRINDSQGHEAGDASLRTFAARIRKSIRRDDLFARVGGDEFIAFMAVRGDAAARAVAARLHDLANAPEPRDGMRLRCSIGALAIPPGEWSLDALVRLADDLMYRAKLRGACLELAIAGWDGRAAPLGRARLEPRAPGARVRRGERRARIGA